MDNAPPTTHRISEFHKWDKEKALTLNPPFQRKPVWGLKNKSFLIDTIVRGLPIPEIYLQVKTDERGQTEYVVVDGQQRIRAILEFIEGEYEILEDDHEEHGGKEFSDLPDGVKKDVWDYPLVVRELTTSREVDVRDVFMRLNKNVVPLNRQELRNAIYDGIFINLVNELAEKDDFYAINRIMSASQIKRQSDSEYISELFIAMMHGIQPKKHDDIDGFFKQYDTNFPNKDDWVRKYRKTLDIIEEIIPDIKTTRWHFRVDFYSLFVAIQELLDGYIFPAERYDGILRTINRFDSEVTTKGTKSKDNSIRDYSDSIEKHTTDRENRKKRNRIIREILIPFLIAKDSKRDFSDEERRIAWMLSDDKKCAICHKVVEWSDYQLDHEIAYNKGGKTELLNSQITHRSCNASKSDK